MPTAQQDYVFVLTGASMGVGVGLWVRLHNHATGVDYFSTAATGGDVSSVEKVGIDTGTPGLRINATQVVTARQTGYTAFTGTLNRATSYDPSTITLVQLAQRVAAIQADLTTHGLIGA